MSPIPNPRTTLPFVAPGVASSKHESRLPWLVATLAAVALPAGLSAADITVTTTADVVDGGDGLISLREAISTFNTDGGTTTITLPTGTFTIALAGTSEDSNATGDFDVSGETGTNLTIRGAGGGATIINGADLDRVFHLQDAANVTLERLKIRNGYVWGGGGAIGGNAGVSAQGGGVLSETSGSLTLRDVIIEDCTARGGSGGTATNVTNTVDRAGVGGAGGDAEGGALAIIGTGSGKSVTLERVGFYRNLAQGGHGNTGGTCVYGEGNAYGGNGGNGGVALGGAVYTNNDTGVDLQFKQVVCEENIAQGGNGGNGGNATHTTDAYTAFSGNSGISGYAFGGAFHVSSDGEAGSTHVFTDFVATDNEANGGNGGNGGIGQTEIPAAIINGGNGGEANAALGGAVFVRNSGYLRFASGNVSGNSATGGNGGNGASSALAGVDINGGDGGYGATGSGGGVHISGADPLAMHIQFDPTFVCTANTASGGNGGSGGNGVNGAIGQGGGGGFSDAPGVHIANYTSVGLTDGSSSVHSNLNTIGLGGVDGDALGSGSNGGILTIQFYINTQPGTKTISGVVWSDSTANNVRNVDERGLAGVDIAFSSGGHQVLNTKTSNDGIYSFSTTWTAESDLAFIANHFTGTFVAQDIGSDEDVDSDVDAGSGVFTVPTSSDNITVDAGYVDPGPITGTFNMTITGSVSAEVTAVSIGSTIVTPTNGHYTISVAVPASAGSVVLVTTGAGGQQSSRTILFDNATLPPG